MLSVPAELLCRVTPCVHLLKLRHRYSRVLHRRVELLVSEHLSDVTHVGTGVQHQRSGCVAKEVTAALLRAGTRTDVGTDQSG